MSRLHAFFSIGNLLGALVVVLFGVLLAEVTPRWSLWTGAVLVLGLLAAVAGVTPQSPRRTVPGDGSGKVPPVAWLLAAMAVCFGLTEGTAVDWSSLHVTDVGGVSPSAGAWGLACVSGFMVVIRLFGDAVVERLGRAAVAGVTPQSPCRTVRGDGSGKVPPVAWLLAAMAVCFGLTEGTAVDWSSLHVTDVGGVSPSAGAWGLACVSGFMVVIRLFGDAVVERLGRAAVVRFGSACALVGYLFTAFFSGLPLILTGWCLVGLGVGLVAPQIYGLAGHIGGGRGLALVVSFGYAAFLVGPALIGFVASHSGLQRAMLVPVVTAVGLIVMSTWLPADPEQTAEHPADHPAGQPSDPRETPA